MGSRVFPTRSTQRFRKTQIQTCIVHLLRNSMDYAGRKDRKPLVTALKSVYRAPDAAAAATALSEFEEGPWGRKYPAITAAWRRSWEQVPGAAPAHRAHRLPIRSGQHPARTPLEARRLGADFGAAHRAAPASLLRSPQRLADHRQKPRRCPRIVLSDSRGDRPELSCVIHAELPSLKSHADRPSPLKIRGARANRLQNHRPASTSRIDIAILGPMNTKISSFTNSAG
jgi:Transposase, Mutator family